MNPVFWGMFLFFLIAIFALIASVVLIKMYIEERKEKEEREREKEIKRLEMMRILRDIRKPSYSPKDKKHILRSDSAHMQKLESEIDKMTKDTADQTTPNESERVDSAGDNSFFDEANLFSDYFYMFIYSPQLSSNSLRKPITAAYLFVIFDYIAMANEKRKLSYEIISTIEDELLSEDELDCYDECVNLFGAIVRKQISPRGDWCFYKGEENNEEGSWLYLLYLCYGDLIRHHDYISNYEGAPLIIEDILDLVSFTDQMSNTVLPFTVEFAEKIEKELR